MKVVVYGLGHLGTVTAACLADKGFDVTGIGDLNVPTGEPGLRELLQRCGDVLVYSNPKPAALHHADILWITFDTPVDANNRADIGWLNQRIAEVMPIVDFDTLVIVSSQVPVGFTARMQQQWPKHTIVCIPENLRRGKAIDGFMNLGRVIVGVGGSGMARANLFDLFAPFTNNVLVMSYESAEMTKHAINAYLATNIVYANELGRLCELAGADPHDVERGMRSDPRVGNLVPVTPGGPITGGTLLRDVGYLQRLAESNFVFVPVLDAISESNLLHVDRLKTDEAA